MANIHPSAVVHPKAKIHPTAKIGPYAVIQSPDVILEEGVEVCAHAFIDGQVHIKKHTKIYPFVSIGSPPQNLSYKGRGGSIEIGENCHIRDYVSINASCGEDEKLVIGHDCFIMSYCHIAHNCTLGNYIVMANNATLGGHVTVGDHANLGGLCAIHQHCRIGDYAMVGGGSMVGADVAPFTLGSGYPMRLGGLNWIGLKRKGIDHEARKKIIKAYRITFLSGLRWDEARVEILRSIEMDFYVQRWIQFCDHSRRGLVPVREKKSLYVKKQDELKYPELVEMG